MKSFLSSLTAIAFFISALSLSACKVAVPGMGTGLGTGTGSGTGSGKKGPGLLSAQVLTFELDEDGELDDRMLADAEDADAISFEIMNGPAHGALSDLDLAQGNFKYKPAQNFNGSDSFTFRVKQAARASEVAQVNIVIRAVNDAPRASALSFSVVEEGTLTSQLSGVDVEGSPLTYAIGTMPTKGTITLNSATGAFVYVASYNAYGADNFTFKVNDGALDTDFESVPITITGVNDAPAANNKNSSVVAGNTVSIQGSGSDPEGSSLTYSIVSQPSEGTVLINASSGVMSYSANLSATGSDTFTYRVYDGQIYSAAATVTVAMSEPSLSGTWRATSVMRGTTACSNVDISLAKADGIFAIYNHSFQCGSSTYHFDALYSYTNSGSILLGDGTAVGSFGTEPRVSIDFTIGVRLRFKIEKLASGAYQLTEQSGNGTFTAILTKY